MFTADSSTRGWVRRLAWLPLSAVFVLLAALSVQRVTDVDVWWQLATGREVAEHGPPRTETLMEPIAGSPRVEPNWLYCLGLHSLHAATDGIEAAVVLKALVLLAAFALVAWAARGPSPISRTNTMIVAGAVLLGVLASSQRLGLRPEACTWFMYAAFLGALGARRVPWWALLIGLTALEAIWANVHSLAVIGPAAVALRLGLDGARAFRVRGVRGGPSPVILRRLGLGCVLLASVSGAFVANPYGPALVRRSIAHFAQMAGLRMIGESPMAWAGAACVSALMLVGVLWLNAPVIVKGWRGWMPRRATRSLAWGGALATVAIGLVVVAETAGSGATSGSPRAIITELAPPLPMALGSWPLECFVLLLVASYLAVAIGRPRRAGMWMAASLIGAAAALISLRAIPLFAIPGAVLLGRSMRGLPGRWSRPMIGAAVVCVAGWMTLGAVTSRLYVLRGDERHFGVSMSPTNDPRELGAMLRAGQLPGPIFNSHRLGGYVEWSGAKSFIDPRASGPLLAEYLGIMERLRNGTPIPFGERRFRTVVLDPDDLGEIVAMSKRPVWRLVLASPTAVAFVAGEGGPQAIQLDGAWLDTVLNEHPAPVRVGGWRAVVSSIETPLGIRRLGRVCVALGASGPGARLLEVARDALPEQFRDDQALAFALLATSQHAEGARAAERGLEREPRDRELLRLAALGNLGAGDVGRAAAWAAKMIDLDPGDAEGLFILGVAEFRAGKNENAIQALRRAVQARPEHANAQANLGAALAKAGRFAEAVEAFSAARRLSPGDRAIDAALRDATRRAAESAK